MNNLEILQNFSVDISKVIRKHIKDIKKLDPKTQRALGNLIGDFKEGIDNIPSMKSESITAKKIDATYLDANGRLYSIKVDGHKIPRDMFKKEFDVDLPRVYDERKLDKIAKLLKKDGITFTHNDAMDVS